jgi:galactose mutarotase-like enzyme
MNYNLDNGTIKLAVSDTGAEPMSIIKDGAEYLWQGDPEFWAGRAYNLFPIVGRLTNGEYTYKGQTYKMNLHGFVRKMQLEVVENKNDKLVFELKSNPETLQQYPFDFVYRVSYKLNGNKISITYEVINSGDKTLYFSVGGHPGFNVPLGGEGKFEDYYLEFAAPAKPQKVIFSKACLVTEGREPYSLVDGVKIPLQHSLFDDDALVLDKMCKTVTLKSDKSERFVRVSYPDMKYIGFWHKPISQAPYVCIEPWASLPATDGIVDDLPRKKDITALEVGKVYINNWEIFIG